MDDKTRKIAVMIGSDSDLPQCLEGFKYLAEQMGLGKINVFVVITNSIHRNTMEVFKNLRILDSMGVDCLITGAGMANHLSGTCDAYLRYSMKNKTMRVIGVAFQDKNDQMNTETARLSIERVPGHQMLGPYIGSTGFLNACNLAVIGDFPPLFVKDPKPTVERSLTEAIEAAEKMIAREA